METPFGTNNGILEQVSKPASQTKTRSSARAEIVSDTHDPPRSKLKGFAGTHTSLKVVNMLSIIRYSTSIETSHYYQKFRRMMT
jgi:hypothetical protein